MKNIELPQWVINIAIEGFQDLARRLEADAAAFSNINTPEAQELARERLEAARSAWKAYEFFIHL